MNDTFKETMLYSFWLQVNKKEQDVSEEQFSCHYFICSNQLAVTYYLSNYFMMMMMMNIIILSLLL